MLEKYGTGDVVSVGYKEYGIEDRKQTQVGRRGRK